MSCEPVISPGDPVKFPLSVGFGSVGAGAEPAPGAAPGAFGSVVVVAFGSVGPAGDCGLVTVSAEVWPAVGLVYQEKSCGVPGTAVFDPSCCPPPDRVKVWSAPSTEPPPGSY